MSAVEGLASPEPTFAEKDWATIAALRPALAATASRYLGQLGLSLRPRSVTVADNVLRIFCHYLAEHHPDVVGFGDVGRLEIEGFKAALVARRTPKGPVSANTVRQRLGMVRTFFDRIIEWDWPEAPARTPVFGSDLPVVDDPLPRFLDDAAAARLLHYVRTDGDELQRLVVEMLLRTGMRTGELCDLAADAVTTMSGGRWLRVPVGKLHNDRYVPLQEPLLSLVLDWRDRHRRAIEGAGHLVVDGGEPIQRLRVYRIVKRAGRRAGVGAIHPHQLRHTLATQAINRGMRLEAIAALLGHKSLRMTMVYARIANRTVADEYHAVSQRVEALYGEPTEPAETPAMRRLAAEHRRMLGNGWCTRPRELDCAFEAMCEGCGFFSTGVEFRPTLERQRAHADAHGQPGRVQVFDRLLEGVEDQEVLPATRGARR